MAKRVQDGNVPAEWWIFAARLFLTGVMGAVTYFLFPALTWQYVVLLGIFLILHAFGVSGRLFQVPAMERGGASVTPERFDIFYISLATASIYCAVLSIAYGMRHWTVGKVDTPEEALRKAVILGCWVILPPVWFAIEYFGLYRIIEAENAQTNKFEKFKQG